MMQLHINEASLLAMRSLEKRIDRVEYLIEDLYDKEFEKEEAKSGLDNFRL